jgi:uncharacterized protein (DUF1501 family)
MKRRTFLKSALATSAVAPFMLNGIPTRANSSLEILAQLPQAADDDRILIICQFFGGNDGINMMPPVEDQNIQKYQQIRPNINVAKDKCWTNAAAAGVYLHPALATGDKGGLANLLIQGKLAFVRNVGYEFPSLSHFRSTDIWLSGISGPNNNSPDLRLDTGWLGRHLQKKYPNFPTDLPDDPLAIQFGGFSLALESSVGRMGIEVNDPSKQQGVISSSDALDADSANTAYLDEYNFVADIAARSDKYAQRVKNAYAAGKVLLKGKYASKDPFATQLANTAALIAGGLKTKVYFVSMGGFDTHVSQTLQGDGTIGLHSQLMSNFSDAVAQFMSDMTLLNHADNVIGISISEFGRRPEENGSFGTDHGAASVMFAFGSQINSGIYGGVFDLNNFDESDNLAVQIDFRRVYADILTTWYGLTIEDTWDILKDDSHLVTPLGLIKSPSGAVKQPRMSDIPFSITSNYPNPFTDRTTIVLYVPETRSVTIEVTDLIGNPVAHFATQTFSKGEHRIPTDLNVAAGSYMVIARSAGGTVTKLIQCLGR